MTLSDSHCHLDRYRPELLAEVLQQARLKRVDIIVSVSRNLESSAETVRLAQSCEGVSAAIGIHPWEVVVPTDEVRRHLYGLTRSQGVEAIGEIGLDYRPDYAPNPEAREMQKELLIYQLALARETGLPVSIHCKEAHEDMMHILRQETSSGVSGTIHGFSGDLAELKDWLALGFYVSIGVRGFVPDGMPSLQEAVREIPLDRLLTETDSVGSGKPSGPADVATVVERLASLRGATVEEMANAATANLKRLLKS